MPHNVSFRTFAVVAIQAADSNSSYRISINTSVASSKLYITSSKKIGKSVPLQALGAQRVPGS